MSSTRSRRVIRLPPPAAGTATWHPCWHGHPHNPRVGNLLAIRVRRRGPGRRSSLLTDGAPLIRTSLSSFSTESLPRFLSRPACGSSICIVSGPLRREKVTATTAKMATGVVCYPTTRPNHFHSLAKGWCAPCCTPCTG